MAMIILGTLIISGCVDNSLGSMDLNSVTIGLEHGQKSAINISGLGLDADSTANLTRTSIFISVTVTKVIGPHIHNVRYDVEIENGKLVAKAANGLSVPVEEKAIYRIDVKYNISSNDPDLKGLNLLGDPKGNNLVSGTFNVPKKNSIDFNDWLVIDGINGTVGKVYKVERNENSNAGKNYVLSMNPFNIQVIFGFTAV
jgi:hypothetical protein